MKRIYHKTPNGGDYSELYLFDEKGTATDQQDKAVRAVITECKMDGTLIRETLMYKDTNCRANSNKDMNLSKYEKKKVIIETTDHQIIRGTVGDYFYPDDNENGQESIIVDAEDRVFPVELYATDILSIELVCSDR